MVIRIVKRLEYSLVILLLSIFMLDMTGCVIPVPQAPSQPPSSPSPPATNSTGSYTSGIPIDASWSPPAAGESGLALPSIAEVVDKATPSIVAIQTEGLTYNIFLQPVPTQGVGTGVVIDSNGYIVTNSHVVEGAKSVKVTLTDGRTFNAIKVNKDTVTDLALIQIEGQNLTPAHLGRSNDLSVGDWVVAIGNALALEGGPTVTAGIISYLGRSIQEPNGVVLSNLIQTDAAINPGNSGGPLLNMAGEVVGINTAIASGAENIGFAISISSALPIIEELIEHGRVTRPWLGIIYSDLTSAIIVRYGLSASEGVFIHNVLIDSPAAVAGLKPGDVIIRFAGQKITAADDLTEALQLHSIGQKVEIVFIRGSEELKITLALVESPPP